MQVWIIINITVVDRQERIATDAKNALNMVIFEIRIPSTLLSICVDRGMLHITFMKFNKIVVDLTS